MRFCITETPRFAVFAARPGVVLERKADGESVYFQPGDDSGDALAHLGINPDSLELEAPPACFDLAAADYF
jgi:hypothetical protein